MKNLQGVLIVLSLILGIFVGALIYDPEWSTSNPEVEHKAALLLGVFEFVGITIFLGLLKMMILPLVASSVVVAVLSVGDFKILGRLGWWTFCYYILTMFAAVGLGLVLVQVISPGEALRGVVTEASVGGGNPALLNPGLGLQAHVESGVLGMLKNLFSLMIPDNIIAASAGGQVLSVIVFSLFFATVSLSLAKKTQIVTDLAEALFSVFMRMTEVVLWIAPLGIFCLLARSVAQIGLDVFGGSIGSYMFTVVLGLAIHALIVLPTILWLLTRLNPLSYFFSMKEALLMAFATSSSSATLPVSLECATAKGGVSRKAAGLVLPLGATVNMDGTALYEAVAVVFMAQAFGVQLGGVQLLLIALTATLAAVGAAGIPSAGLITMLIVVEAVNGSLLAADPHGMIIPATAVALVIGVDRILDMIRTTVNVWGDAVGAKIISHYS